MFIILQIWFNSRKLAWMECFFSICVFILYQCETFVNWWITVLDEQCETFVICNDGTMCWLCMYIWWNLCVGYDCYMDACCIYMCWISHMWNSDLRLRKNDFFLKNVTNGALPSGAPLVYQLLMAHLWDTNGAPVVRH